MSKLSHNKLAAKEQVLEQFHSGMSLLAGGFGSAGYPTLLYEWLYETDCTELDIITSGVAPADKPFQLGFAGLLRDKRIRSLTLTHAANNPEVGRQKVEGTLKVEAVPQGTFVERIRAGGAGLGGVLTPTGIGTPVAEGKQILHINGRDYLLELPIRGPGGHSPGGEGGQDGQPDVPPHQPQLQHRHPHSGRHGHRGGARAGHRGGGGDGRQRGHGPRYLRGPDRPHPEGRRVL